MRKFGKVNVMSTKFDDYNYIINGVGGIGKTTMAYELGKKIAGSDEGTFIITCGAEPAPTHIPGAFGDVAKTMEVFSEIVDELCTNKEEYPDTKFVAIDSLDEFMRMAEDYVVREWNSICRKSGDLASVAKSIAQAYKGYQKGENRVVDVVLKLLTKLQDSGYHFLFLGHTKIKSKDDPILNIKYEQLTCNLDNKYYNAIKDKVNLVAMCYFENVIENVTEEKNPFTKMIEKRGELVSKKRVMVFVDDDNAIDTKSHFEYIDNKVDFGANNLVNAVETAIKRKLEAPVGEHKSPEHVEMQRVITEVNTSAPTAKEDEIGIEDTSVSDLSIEEPAISIAERVSKVRASFAGSNPELKKEIKKVLVESTEDGKLSENIPEEALSKIEGLLGL